MDSCNSGSLQSSSGNDEESYDSRAAAPIPPFLPNPPLFEPLPNPYFLNSTIPWTRPDPDPACFQAQNKGNNISFNDAPPPQTLPAPARNSKKRPRASRRAPTTVLTTDTTNFRAMVQEFTGVPSPPFQTTTTKLDLFPGAPPYLRRPLPQRPLATVPRTVKPANGTTPISSGSSSSFTQNSNVFDINRFQSSYKFPFSGSSDVMGFGLDCHESGVGSNLVHDGAGDRDHQQQGVNGSVDSWICANSD